MKEYNRKTKRWEEVVDNGKPLKKRETCRGGKPHDMVLTLPSYISTKGEITSEAIELYYQLEEERNEYNKSNKDKLAQIGIFPSMFISPIYRHIKCSICGKESYIK